MILVIRRFKICFDPAFMKGEPLKFQAIRQRKYLVGIVLPGLET